MRIISTILTASLLSATSAFAADTGPLTAGKPAGVHSAQILHVNPLIFFGAVAVGLGVALAVSSGNNNSGTSNTGGGSTTTSSTSTA
jgi:hypothetical protein